MTPDRWQRLKTVFQEAVDRAPQERARYLAVETAGDPELRIEVERMLSHSTGDGPLDRPAWENLRIEAVLPAGAYLGPYEIVEQAGAGGMGRVYKARDTRLGRIVAIKVLKPEFHDRLREEGRAISALSHPHVCALYDIGEQDDARFLVMEFLEGESLAAMLARGPLPLEQVADYGIQIASALAAAHAQGIVHRDLKPANIMITAAGAKVLDFGIAVSARDNAEAAGGVAGTAAYMSPSRWIGSPADARSDVFALGLVLYEMAVGAGEIQGLRRLGELPPGLVALISRCVREDGSARLQRMEDVRTSLESFRAELASPSSKRPAISATALAWAAALVASLAIAFAAWKALPPTRSDAPLSAQTATWPAQKSEPQETSTAIPAPRAAQPYVPMVPKIEKTATPPAPTLSILAAYPGQQRDPAFSPDGSKLAFSWNRSGYGVFVKNLRDDSEPRRISPDGARDWGSAWSPDGRNVAFERRGSKWGIYRAAVEAGEPHMVSAVSVQRDDTLPQVSWSRDGKWIAAPDHDTRGVTQICLFDASTGERRALTAKPVGSSHAPAFSPNGKQLAYAYCEAPNFPCDIFTIDLSSDGYARSEKQITDQGVYIRGIAWLPTGRALVFSEARQRNSTETHLWRVSVNPPSVPQRIELAGSDARHPTISNAGGRLAFTRVPGWNLMVIDDFR